MTTNALGELLKEKRIDQRFSQRLLAEYLQRDGHPIYQARLSRIEAGAPAYWAEIAAILDTLNLSDKEIIKFHREAVVRYKTKVTKELTVSDDQ